MKSLKNRLIALAVVASLALASVAFAQGNGITYGRSDSIYPVGHFLNVYNAIDSLITDGTIVSVDTTTAATTNLKRIVVRPYAGTSITRYRCIGVAAGDIQRSSRGGFGRILIDGYHPNVRMSTSNVAANVPLKIAPATEGSFATGVDSLGASIGWFIGMNAGVARTGGVVSTGNGVTYTGRVVILRPISTPYTL